MDRDWLKHDLTVALDFAEREGIPRDKWPDFLSQHAVNNWEQIQRAKKSPTDILANAINVDGHEGFQSTKIVLSKYAEGESHVTRDTPTYYDRNE